MKLNVLKICFAFFNKCNAVGCFFFFERLTVKKPEITLNYKLSGSTKNEVKKNTLSFATVPKPVCDTFFNYTFTHEDTIHDPQLTIFFLLRQSQIEPSRIPKPKHARIQYFLVRSATIIIVKLKMRNLKDLNLKRWRLLSFHNGMSNYQEYLSNQGQIRMNSAKFFKVRYTQGKCSSR